MPLKIPECCVQCDAFNPQCVEYIAGTQLGFCASNDYGKAVEVGEEGSGDENSGEADD
jgi:hypothetical protein